MQSKLGHSVRSPLFWLVILYVLVGIVYAIVTPLMEKPDEGGHYGYILYLREQRTLPPLQPPLNVIWTYEFKQPPLYYAVTAVLTSWLPDTPDVRQSVAFNPYMWESVPGYRNDNRNRYLHPPDMTLLFLAARLVSLLFGLGSMIASYFLAAQLFPKHTGVPIATAALVGFQPQFIFIATAVNNDAAAAFWGTLAITLLVYRLKKEGLPHFAVLMGGILGLAIITKVSALVFFPLTGLALLLIHRGFSRAFFRDGVVIVTVAVLVGGWWYGRNAFLYHDPFTLRAHNMLGANPNSAMSWNQLRHTLFSVEQTFWANQARVFVSPITLDQVLIWWGRIGLVLAAMGCVLHSQSVRANLPIEIVLSSWPIVFFVLLVGFWNQRFPWPFGRLLFPALAPIALLLVVGWWSAPPPRWRRLALTLSVGMVVVTSSSIPFVSLYPLYHPSRVQRAEQVEHPVGTIYVDSETGVQIARLIGYNLPNPYASPGAYFPIELCWEPLGQTDRPYTMFVQLLDLSRLAVSDSPGVWGRRMTYPGLGSRATDRWSLHQAFCDTILTQVFPETPAPLGAAIEVGFFDDLDGHNRLEAIDTEGSPIALAVIGGVPIISPQTLTAKPTARYTFDDAIGLEQVQISNDLSSSITLTLTWQPLRRVPYDATVFVHVRRPDGSMAAQVDRQPLEGRFPTSYWIPNHVITDTVSLSLPPGAYDGPLVLDLGMYTWPSLQRLPVVDASGAPLADDVIVVGVSRP